MNGAELRRQCAIHGLPYQELAREAGVSPATISHALSGRPVSTATLRAIASALGRREQLPGIDSLLAGPMPEPRDKIAAPSPTPGAAITAAMPMGAKSSGRQAAE